MNPRNAEPDIRILGTHRAKLGESPVWSVRDSRLYWVDIDGRSIQSLTWGASESMSWELPGRPSCLALTEEPGVLIVGMGAGVIEYDTNLGTWDELLALESTAGVRMNDGRTDPRGRLWIGSMDERNDQVAGYPAGHLFRVDLDGSTSTIMSGVATSNGLAFSPDERFMYWTDSAEQVVWRFDYDADSGGVTNKVAFFDFGSLPGKPDGACMDVDGCYWVACVYGWSVVRITPDGRLDRVIELPVHKPSMPAFVGPTLDTMVITSISSGGRQPTQVGSVPPGSLIQLDPGVQGLPEPASRLRV